MTITALDGRSGSRAAPRVAAPGRLLAVALFLGFVALTLVRSDLLADPDTQWHVATAAWAWANGRLPSVDVFSYTFAGEPWIAKEWLAQFALALPYALLGWTGPALAASAASAAAVAVVFAFVRARLGLLIGLIGAVSAYCLLQSQILARPHVFVFPIAALWTAELARAAEERRRPSWLLVPLMALWANVHATFPLGLAVAGALAGEALLAAPRGERPRVLARWAAFGLAVLLACGLTPYGFEPLLVMLRMAGGNEGVPLIDEWQPLGLDAHSAVALALVATAAFAFGRRLRANLCRALLVAFLAWLGYRHARFSGFGGIVGIVLLAGPVAAAFDPADLRARLEAALPRRAWLLAFAGAALAVSLAMLVARPPMPAANVAPRGALAFAEARGLTRGPVYNHYNFGGFLVFNGVKTFIDGRTDQLFLGGFMKRLAELEDGADGAAFTDFIERRGATWALVGPDTGDFRHLSKSPGWRKVYEDADAAVFERAGG